MDDGGAYQERCAAGSCSYKQGKTGNVKVGGTWEGPYKHKEELLTARLTADWNRLPERLWSPLPWRYSKPSVPTCATCSRELALAGSLGLLNSRGSFRLLSFCDFEYLIFF